MDELTCGEVGFVVANIKDIFGAPVRRHADRQQPAVRTQPAGLPRHPAASLRRHVPGGPPTTSRIFRESLQKLAGLNDSALQFEPENSTALGFGFRNRLSWGLLHLEIVQ